MVSEEQLSLHHLSCKTVDAKVNENTAANSENYKRIVGPSDKINAEGNVKMYLKHRHKKDECNKTTAKNIKQSSTQIIC